MIVIFLKKKLYKVVLIALLTVVPVVSWAQPATGIEGSAKSPTGIEGSATDLCEGKICNPLGSWAIAQMISDTVLAL